LDIVKPSTLYEIPPWKLLKPKVDISLSEFKSLKDGVLSAFEHHCSGCYNLPFTGFIFIPTGANLSCIYY
jgi:hypothetical protein